jgi:hypothetical protein
MACEVLCRAVVQCERAGRGGGEQCNVHLGVVNNRSPLTSRAVHNVAPYIVSVQRTSVSLQLAGTLSVTVNPLKHEIHLNSILKNQFLPPDTALNYKDQSVNVLQGNYCFSF